MSSYDHETDAEYEEMKKVEKSILDHYTEYMEEYDPMADGLFDSWNWDTKELDFTLCCHTDLNSVVHAIANRGERLLGNSGDLLSHGMANPKGTFL